MTLLFDENLSRKLVSRLADLFPGSSHVTFANLLQCPDAYVWEYAKAHGYAIVTADADFHEMAMTFGPPPKVIWLRGCNYPTLVAEQILRGQAIRIGEFLRNVDQSVLILKP
ncbi:MAG TPA: DUF5615 family PIN-like protein [Bryobacteraceae bacterium]|nr:DUF5615 family PIN-like protein [Bryobacteraceae bacterium]